MRSEQTATRSGAYRDAPPAIVSELTVRYVPFVWSAPIPSLVVAAAFVWATEGEPPERRVTQGLCALAFALAFAFARFPIVTIKASLLGGEVHVSGTRFPGRIQTWTLSPQEAVRFEVIDDGRSSFRGIALRTTNGQTLPLAPFAYPGSAAQLARPTARLNAWLGAVRT